MALIKTPYPARLIHIDRVYLTGGDTLEDVTGVIVNGFLIVETDTAGDWYNINTIERLENVEYINQSGSAPRVG